MFFFASCTDCMSVKDLVKEHNIPSEYHAWALREIGKSDKIYNRASVPLDKRFGGELA